MTNELEKTFFDTFGIEPKLVESCTKPRHKCTERFIKDCSECPKAWRKYPQITDRILLELICIVTNHTDIIRGFATVENLKTFVLEELIYDIAQMKDENTKHQVRTLFKEG